KYAMRDVPLSAIAPGTTITCVRERELFDTLMRSMPKNTKVYLGPGEFCTKGTSPNVVTWEPKSGQSIIGAGIALTTIKLVGASIPESHTAAIGVYYYTFVEQFTIASLTIDCNVFGQLNPYVTCGAISLP